VSVTLKLADSDAKLIADILNTVGKAAVHVRAKFTSVDAGFVDTPQALRSVALMVDRHGFTTPDALTRLGAAFETAVNANAKGR